ncbi:VOC family protein [Flavobacteriaceae bacterium S356]|uniref:VOC family protein n=1 Tax=Asprobacillus argus TaxID=3076534 RepID=A0ABU3LGX2_9FLAO|nr:VOC family protein [Flavobacteriaceae bacterium S356]
MEVNMISWFEIPVNDMNRAKKFYEAVFQVPISINDFGGILMGWFPPAEDITAPGISGSLVQHEEYVPSRTHGPLVYFNSQSGDIDHELGRIEEAGGTILKPKILISNEVGYMAVIVDTEGNRIALYNK